LPWPGRWEACRRPGEPASSEGISSQSGRAADVCWHSRVARQRGQRNPTVSAQCQAAQQGVPFAATPAACKPAAHLLEGSWNQTRVARKKASQASAMTQPTAVTGFSASPATRRSGR
jgi:hypothetical protein